MRSFKSILLRISVVFILCIAVVLSSTIMPIAAGLAGDVNADDTLTAEDLTIVRKSLLNGETNTEYDINGDGSVDIRDLVNLKKKLLDYVDGEKFIAKDVTEIGNADAVQINELFTAMDGVKIDSGLVSIDVDAGDSDVSYEIIVDSENWENSTILFNGTGEVTVTIREYCKITSITFNLVKEAKFAVSEDLKEVYGNVHKVYARELFTELGYYISTGDVKLTAKTLSGDVTATVYEDTDSWQNFTIDLDGTGEVEVTIEADSIPTAVVIKVDDVVKFYANDSISDEYGNASIITLGTLFHVDYEQYNVDSAKVEVITETLSGTVSANIELDTENWENSKIEFDGKGSIAITIKEDSKPTTVELNVVLGNKFELKVDDPYTVKNTENVVLGDIFAELTDVDVDSDKVNVTVTQTQGDVKWADFVVDTNDWTKSEIDFSFEGQVSITIEEDSKPVTLAVIVEAIEKFAPVEGVAVDVNTTVTLGDLFTLLDGVTVDSAIVEVTTDNGTYTKADDWKNSTITFTTVGTATVTIKEDSKVATVTVTVKDIEPTDKFQIKFPNTDKYLYRVGNGNAVALDSLFSAIEGADIRNVNATVTAIEGANVSGVFTPNADWTKATIQFSGTGIVKVTVKDDYYCNELELLLEVVDAKNATTATSATANNVVLLNDCGLSTISVENGYTLYGNGFTLSSPNDITGDSMSSAYVTLNNGTLDNVKVICPNFSLAIMYMEQVKVKENVDATAEWRFHNIRCAVTMNNNSKIYNSYISGGRAAVYVTSGYATIENTTIYGGATANIQVGAAQSITLRDVNLIQEPIKATVNDTSKTVMGFSVIITCSGDGSSTPITLEGKLVQYAWAKESYKSYVPSDANMILEYILKQDAYKHNFSIDGQANADWLNLGFAYMPGDTGTVVNIPSITDNRTNKTNVPYDVVTIEAFGTTARVYSYKNTKGTDSEFLTKPEYVSNKQEPIMPNISYSETNESIVFSKKYDEIKGWSSILTVDLDAVGSYNFDFSKLIAEKYGNALTYTVTDVNGNKVEKASAIALTGSGVNDYVLNVVCDRLYDANGQLIEGATETYQIPFTLVATMTSIAPPEKVAEVGGTPLLVVKSKNGEWSCAIPALEGTQIKYWSVANKAYTTLTLSSLTPTSTGKQNGTNNYWEYSATNGDYTLKVTCGVIHEGKGIYGMPIVVNNSGNKMYFTISSTNGYVGTGTTARTVTVSYEFKDNNGGTLTFSKTWNCVRSDMINAGAKQYSYDSFVNGTLKEAGGCVTPDTLVTLADGSKKRIDQVTYNDKLLVWDFYKGEYTAVPCAIVMNHGYGNYNVVTLRFEDGTVVKTINGHGFFDIATNEYILLDEYNVADYVGHTFVKTNGDGYSTTKLIDYSITNEYTESWSVLTAVHHNAIIEGMWSLTAAEVEDSPKYVMPFAVGEDMRYDEAAMQVDIEKYGLYTYEEFVDIIPYEAFVALNIPNFKVAIGKGYITYDELIFLLKLHVK